METTPDQWRDLLKTHLERYPASRALDIYVLIHQATLGVGRDLDDPAPLREGLVYEVQNIDDLTPRSGEEIAEPIAPGDSGMVRIHLRPYLRSGGSVDRLVEAMIKTSDAIAEEAIDRLGVSFGQVRQILPTLDPPFPPEKFDLLLRELIKDNLPVRSHSDAYIEAYDPHYRPILRDALQ